MVTVDIPYHITHRDNARRLVFEAVVGVPFVSQIPSPEFQIRCDRDDGQSGSD